MSVGLDQPRELRIAEAVNRWECGDGERPDGPGLPRVQGVRFELVLEEPPFAGFGADGVSPGDRYRVWSEGDRSP